MSAEWGAHQLADWVQSMGHEEINWLAAQMADLPPDPIIVNIGAAAGVSTITMLEARPDALIYSCEVDPGAGEFWSIDKAGLDKAHVIRLGESAQAGREFVGMVDFIFVDGGHDAVQVRADIDAWLPHLKDGCVMAFHDYNNTVGWPGVSAGVDPVMGHYPVVANVASIRAYRNE